MLLLIHPKRISRNLWFQQLYTPSSNASGLAALAFSASLASSMLAVLSAYTGVVSTTDSARACPCPGHVNASTPKCLTCIALVIATVDCAWKPKAVKISRAFFFFFFFLNYIYCLKSTRRLIDRSSVPYKCSYILYVKQPEQGPYST